MASANQGITQKSGEPVPQVRILNIIEILATDVLRGFKHAELTDRTGFARSNVLRDLKVLELSGYARKDGAFWKLAPKWHAIAMRFEQQMTMAQQQLTETMHNVQASARQI